MAKLIGKDPNQVPLNSELGTMARQDHTNASVDQLTVSKGFQIRQGNNYSASDFPVYSSGSDTRPVVTFGKYTYIKSGDALGGSFVDNFSGANRLLIHGVRKAPSSAGGASSPINLLKFHYYAPYRGAISIRMNFNIGADGNYSTKFGESYYYLKNYNNSITEVKTNSSATTRNLVDMHSSTGTHHIEWLEFEPSVTSGQGNVVLQMHGSGSQWGGYDIGFGLEITNLSSSPNGNQFGIHGLMID